MSRLGERGTTTVEFAICGAVVITVILGAIEVNRAMFTLSVLKESTRRGARVAAVCPINDPAILETTRFVSVPNLTNQNVRVEYLDQAGVAIANPTANFGTIEYVRVRIVNYQLELFIPYANRVFPSPEFAVTFPRESLGVPRTGVVTPC
jgi:hypothetical protein